MTDADQRARTDVCPQQRTHTYTHVWATERDPAAGEGRTHISSGVRPERGTPQGWGAFGITAGHLTQRMRYPSPGMTKEFSLPFEKSTT
jgi:hypothetical protein